MKLFSCQINEKKAKSKSFVSLNGCSVSIKVTKMKGDTREDEMPFNRSRNSLLENVCILTKRTSGVSIVLCPSRTRTC